jgi:hypothetical protein
MSKITSGGYVNSRQENNNTFDVFQFLENAQQKGAPYTASRKKPEKIW